MFGIGSGKSIVGLDIGSSCIKAIELKRSKGEIVVSHLGVEPLASDIVVDSMIVDSGSVSSAISKLFAQHNIKSKNVATSVSGHSVIVKPIKVQPMTEADLAEGITTEAAQHIPFDIADVNVDFDILNPDDTGPQMDVLLVAVKKDKILNYTNVLSLAGKSPAVVDIDAFALQNCYEYNYQPSHDSTVALLNLGASVMNINIVKGVSPLFTRDVSVGGNQYTDSLQKELDLSFEDAENLKKGENIAGVAEEHRATILRSVTDILVLEIQKTFDFFRATSTGESIQKIVVAGGSSRVPGLMDVLREEFAIPVEEMYPFRKIVINPARHNEDQIRELAPRLAIAVGLALRSFDEP